MTTHELIELAGEQWIGLLVWFAAVPLVALALGFCHRVDQGGASPWRYVYAVMIYCACFPGMLAIVLTAYSLFFTKQDLLAANVLVYFLPIVSMGVTLALIRSRVDFGEIPGFGRIAGLMILVAVTFIIILAIEKTRIWIVFAASFTRLLVLTAVLFVLLKFGAAMLFGGPRPPSDSENG